MTIYLNQSLFLLESRSVPGPQLPPEYLRLRGRLQVVGQSEEGHRVDEHLGGVELVAELARRVIPRERVVVVVPPLPLRDERHQPVVGGGHPDIEGPAAERVGGGVDEPRAVKHDDVAAEGVEEGGQLGLAEQVVLEHGREEEREEQAQGDVVPEKETPYKSLKQ